MERTHRSRALVALLALGACSSPQPAVDEERIARRVVDLLRREGLVIASDGGAPTEGDEDAAEDDPGDDVAPAPVAPVPVAPVASAPRSAQRPPITARASRDVARARPTISDAPFVPAVTVGEGAAARVWTSLDGAVSVGPADALVTAVVFVDAMCPYCARLFPALRALQRAHATELRLAVRHRPLALHPAAWGGAVLAEFARANGGDAAALSAWDRLFAQSRALDRATLEAHAAALGFDPMRLTDALVAQGPTPFDRAIASDDALAESAGVNATPTTLFNGRRVPGALPPEALEAVFAEERARASAALARGVRRAALYDHLWRTAAPDISPAPRRSAPRAP